MGHRLWQDLCRSSQGIARDVPGGTTMVSRAATPASAKADAPWERSCRHLGTCRSVGSRSSALASLSPRRTGVTLTHGCRSSASPAVCCNCRGFPSRLARSDPTRQHALAPSPASAVPRRRAKKWAVYQALGIGTLARVPCREPPPRVLPSSATGWAPEGRSPEAGTGRALPREGHGERAMRTITSTEPPTEPRWMREGRLPHPWAADRGTRLRQKAASVLKSRGGDQWSW